MTSSVLDTCVEKRAWCQIILKLNVSYESFLEVFPDVGSQTSYDIFFIIGLDQYFCYSILSEIIEKISKVLLCRKHCDNPSEM